MSSTNFGSCSSFQAAVLLLVIYQVSEFFLNGRGPVLFVVYLCIYFVFFHYNG